MEFQVVVMRYMEDVAWVEYLDNAIIYNKGDKINSKHPVINLPNLGMYHASQIYHCIKNYNNLAELTLFIQANPWDGDLERDLKLQNTPSGIEKLIKHYKTIPNGEMSSLPLRQHTLYKAYDQPFNWNQRHHNYFIKYTHSWQEFLDHLIDPEKLINWKLPTRFYKNGHICLRKEAILSNPIDYYIKLLEYWKYDVPCAEWFAESILGLIFNVSNNGKLIDLNHSKIDFSSLEDYKTWVYEID